MKELNILPAFRKTREVLRADTPGQAFHQSSPMLYSGIMKNWAAYPKWNFQYFRERYSDRKISADRNVGGRTSYIYTDLASYIRYVFSTKQRIPYYAKANFHLLNEMSCEYDAPPQFRCWYKEYHQSLSLQRKIDLSCIYLGPTGSRSTVHRDIWGTSFWNALFEGRKLWLFFSADEERYLYDGKVDPMKVNEREFPLFYDAVPLVCIQQPGELIYCPGNIWHWAIALEPSIALSENFINEENYQNVLKHFERRGYLNAMRKMEEIARLFLHYS